MKIDFKNINEKNIFSGRVFYLYGNYKKAFGAFCDFVVELLREKNAVNVHFCSVAECIKLVNEQCDLFGTNINCFCIRNLEDAHLEKLTQFLETENNIFILESGDYIKSKKITDYFVNSAGYYAVASFKNDLTLQSLCKMYFPKISSTTLNEIIKLINETDEELSSFFRKISLLLDGENENLNGYVTYKQTFLDGLDFIPLVRFLLQSIIREKVFDKGKAQITSTDKNAVSFLLDAELKQKFGFELSKSYLYHETQPTNLKPKF